jgi:hypothetical protein
MSVYTYIEVYKKDKSYIISENSVLGIFQVDFEEKEKFNLSDFAISFHGGIRSLDKQKYVDLGRHYEIYKEYTELFMFYALAVGEYGETVKRTGDKMEGLLFDPKMVLAGVETLIKIIHYFEKEDLEEIKNYQEPENLEKLREILIKAVEMDLLIGCRTA